jgi:hypothetical protein
VIELGAFSYASKSRDRDDRCGRFWQHVQHVCNFFERIGMGFVGGLAFGQNYIPLS